MSCIKIPAVVQNDHLPRKEETNDANKYYELISSAKKVFGNTWSHSETNSTIDFIDSSGGKFFVGCQTTVKVQLSNGIYHEASSFSSAEASTKGLAIEKSKRASVTDAFAKSLSCFSEMDTEINQINSCPKEEFNISNIARTKFPIKVQNTPPAQSTPRRPKTPLILEKGQEVKVAVFNISDDKKNSEPLEEMQADIGDLDVIFDIPVQSVAPSVSKLTISNPAALSEEEQRLERKRKQREKQELFKKQMKTKEENMKQNTHQELQKPNPKF